MSDDAISITVLKAQRGFAVKKRTRLAHGKETKSDPTLTESFWRMARVQLEADVDRIVRFLLRMALRQDCATVHGVPAPGVSPNQWVRRWSAEVHGPDRTLFEQGLGFLPLDIDDAPLPQGSVLDQGQNLFAAAEYARETFLPPALRDVDLAVAAASSTGFKPNRLSMHAYAVLDRSVPMQAAYRYLAGAKAAGYPLDPRPALPAQLFLTGRPWLWGLDDPVPQSLWAFMLPGRRQRVTSIDWNEFDAPLAKVVESERHAHVAGAELGWRAVLDCCLGDGEGRLVFFKPLSISLGYAARSGEPVDQIAGAMHAIVSTHPDLNAERAGQYTPHWLRCEVLRLRAKDAIRAASVHARIDAVRRRFPGIDFWHG
jgi:hypothetical protein